MLACKQQVFLFSRGSNRATPTHMSKISCVAAALNVRWTFVQRGPERSVDKARASCVFANVRGLVLNSYIIPRFIYKNTTGELVFNRLRVDW